MKVAETSLLFLLCLSACNYPFRPLSEEPSVADTYVRIDTDASDRGLVIGTWAPEGDWSYGVYADVRLESLVVTGADGAAIDTGSPRFTPLADWGGKVFVPLSTLQPGPVHLHVRGRFVGLGADGQALVTRDFDEEVKTEE